jgi:hypothetical protein
MVLKGIVIYTNPTRQTDRQTNIDGHVHAFFISWTLTEITEIITWSECLRVSSTEMNSFLASICVTLPLFWSMLDEVPWKVASNGGRFRVGISFFVPFHLRAWCQSNSKPCRLGNVRLAVLLHFLDFFTLHFCFYCIFSKRLTDFKPKLAGCSILTSEGCRCSVS